jgi:ubiquinone/menaquinone biosynthesis C-methylase UbiE
MRNVTPQELQRRKDLLRRVWAKHAPRYDKQMTFWERRIFGPDHRVWACSRAMGNTLEVGIGTGLNLPYYPSTVRLTGVDLSPEMLEIAAQRAAELDRQVALQEGDALDLPFPESRFDTVVCTYSLCNVPDEFVALGEMKRTLRRGGKLLLVDHVRSSVKPIYWAQRMFEFISIRREGEHMTRRPLDQVRQHGFEIEEQQRSKAGVVERIAAIKA